MHSCNFSLFPACLDCAPIERFALRTANDAQYVKRWYAGVAEKTGASAGWQASYEVKISETASTSPRTGRDSQ